MESLMNTQGVERGLCELVQEEGNGTLHSVSYPL